MSTECINEECGNQTNSKDGECAVCKVKKKHLKGGDEMTAITNQKKCVDCKNVYKPTSNAQIRCPGCAEEHKRTKKEIQKTKTRKSKGGKTNKRLALIQKTDRPNIGLSGLAVKGRLLLHDIKLKLAALEELVG